MRERSRGHAVAEVRFTAAIETTPARSEAILQSYGGDTPPSIHHRNDTEAGGNYFLPSNGMKMFPVKQIEHMQIGFRQI